MTTPPPGSASPRKVSVSTVRSGFGWLAFANYSNRVLSLVTTLVLAKLLTPTDFGLVAIASVLIDGIQVFKDMGLSEAVIFSKREDRAALDTAHTILVSYNLLLFAITVIAAPFMARAYDSSSLVVIVPLLSSSLVVGALRSVPLTLIRKDLEYRRLALPDLIPTTVASLASLGLAATGFGVWSLVIKSVLQSVLALVILQVITPFRPKFAFDRAAAAELFRYGRFIVGTSVFLVALYNVDKFFVSRVAGLQALGVYQLAISIAELPIKQLSFLVGAVMFPVFSRIGRGGRELRDVFLKTLKYTASLTLPASAGLAVFGPALVRLLYGAEWQGLDVVLGLLPFYAGCRSLSSIVHDLFKATGQPQLMQVSTIFKLAVIVVAGLPTLHYFGVAGMAILLALTFLAGLTWEVGRVAQILETSRTAVVRVLAAPAALSLTVMPAVWAVSRALGVSEGWLGVGASAVVAGLLYGGCLYLVDRDLTRDLRSVLRSGK